MFVEFEGETLQERYVVGHHLRTESLYRSDRACIVLIIATVNVSLRQLSSSCSQLTSKDLQSANSLTVRHFALIYSGTWGYDQLSNMVTLVQKKIIF